MARPPDDLLIAQLFPAFLRGVIVDAPRSVRVVISLIDGLRGAVDLDLELFFQGRSDEHRGDQGLLHQLHGLVLCPSGSAQRSKTDKCQG